MRKIAEKLLADKKITQTEFDQVKDLTKEAFFGLMAEEAGKVGLGQTGKTIKEIMQIVGLGALGAALGSETLRKLNLWEQQSKAYEEMKEKVPLLKEFPEGQIKDYYEVVKTFSPRSAANPLVAGALVNKMLQFGGVDHKLVQDIASIEGPQRDILIDIATKAGTSLAGFPGGGKDKD
jgi:hypothetical protein